MAENREQLVEVAIPVYNEEQVLEASIRQLHGHLDAALTPAWRIVVVDNASTDGTWEVAQGLEQTFANVRALHLPQKGRGRALKAAWQASDADVVSYMDVDLSTSLDHFMPLVGPLLAGESDVAIGSRLLPTSNTRRQWKREIMSRTYNALIHLGFSAGFSDAQCGFKAITKAAAQRLLPQVEDTSWFFDTELLLLAAHHGFRIHEVPVHWIEDLDSRVNVRKTVAEDLKGLWRMRRNLRTMPREVGAGKVQGGPEVHSTVSNPRPDARDG
jgi:glycosyltransferase involved in cell wall biosynthesis